MEKKAIGFKINVNIALVALMVLGGLGLAVGGIMIWIFVIQGAAGGAIAGGMIGGGGALVGMGVLLQILPNELVHIDDRAVYLPKVTVDFSEIQNISYKGSAVTIVRKDGKKFMQGYLKNCEECYQKILDAANQTPPQFTPDQPEQNT